MSIALAGYEPVTFGSRVKHTNHHTTEATNAQDTLRPDSRMQLASVSKTAVVRVPRLSINKQQVFQVVGRVI
jgi:hypothetical protein